MKEGKVKYLGLSEASPAEIRAAHAIHPISAIQLELSLWTRDAQAWQAQAPAHACMLLSHVASALSDVPLPTHCSGGMDVEQTSNAIPEFLRTGISWLGIFPRIGWVIVLIMDPA